MARETKAQKAEREEAIERLRGMLAPGATIYCTLKHCSRSGMQREISLHAVQDGSIVWLSGLAARAIGDRLGKRDGIIIGGCGMDMGFALVYNLSHTLYGAGFGCIGRDDAKRLRCPSSDHNNGDRDYTPHGSGQTRNTALTPDLFQPVLDQSKWGANVVSHYHTDGGYALRHEWL